MSKLKRTPTRMKFDGMTFIHYAKANEENCFDKEYIVAEGGIRYFRMREAAISLPDQLTEDERVNGLFDQVLTIPTKAEVAALEKKDLVVAEDGGLQEVKAEEKPRIIEHPSGKKMKRRFLNPKTGNYVSYVRAIQLKLVSGS